MESFLQFQQQTSLYIEYYRHHLGAELRGYVRPLPRNWDLYCRELYTPVSRLYNCEFIITVIHSTQSETLTRKVSSLFFLHLISPFPIFSSFPNLPGIVSSQFSESVCPTPAACVEIVYGCFLLQTLSPEASFISLKISILYFFSSIVIIIVVIVKLTNWIAY
jgi:hypothetical protein